MKMRCTLVIDADFPTEKAMERFDTTDPYAVAAKWQAEAIELAAERDDELALVSVHVVPIFGD